MAHKGLRTRQEIPLKERLLWKGDRLRSNALTWHIMENEHGCAPELSVHHQGSTSRPFPLFTPSVRSLLIQPSVDLVCDTLNLSQFVGNEFSTGFHGLIALIASFSFPLQSRSTTRPALVPLITRLHGICSR